MANNNNNIASESLQKLKPHFLKIEITLATIAVVGLILKIYYITAGGLILLGSLALLSIFYVLSAQLPVETEDENRGYILFANKMEGFSYAIVVIGVLFWIMHWPDPKINFYAGIFGLSVSLLVYVLKLKNFQQLPKIVIFLSIALFFALTPESKSNHKVQTRTEKTNNK